MSSAYLESGKNTMITLGNQPQSLVQQPNSVSGYVRIKSREQALFGTASGEGSVANVSNKRASVRSTKARGNVIHESLVSS